MEKRFITQREVLAMAHTQLSQLHSTIEAELHSLYPQTDRGPMYAVIKDALANAVDHSRATIREIQTALEVLK